MNNSAKVLLAHQDYIKRIVREVGKNVEKFWGYEFGPTVKIGGLDYGEHCESFNPPLKDTKNKNFKNTRA